MPPACLDVTAEASVRVAFAALGPVDALVNLAGFAPERRPVDRLDDATWAEMLDTNLTAAMRVARAALPNLRQAGEAAIGKAASDLAARMPAGYAAYSAAKAGLIARTKPLAVENAPAIQANAVAPGAVRTAYLTGRAVHDGAGFVDQWRRADALSAHLCA